MLCDPNTTDLIKEHFKSGHSIFETYEVLCEKFNMKFFPIEEVYAWMDESPEERHKYVFQYQIREVYIQLLQAINNYFILFQKSINYFGSNFGFNDLTKLCYPNPRYGYTIEMYGVSQLHIMDYFHGEKRIFPITGKTFNNENNSFEIFTISIDRFLLLEQIYGRDNGKASFYLLQVDFNEEVCRVIDQVHNAVKNVVGLLFDEEDQEKFAIQHFDQATTHRHFLILQGQIKHNFILINPKEATKELNTFVMHRYFRKNQIFGFNVESDADENGSYINKFEYLKFDLNLEGRVVTEQKRDIELSDELKKMQIEPCGYTLWNNVCLLWAYDIKRQSSIIQIDLKTFEASFLPFDCQQIFYAHDIQVDENDVLTILTQLGAVYRFPLRRPESLQNTWWFTLRRKCLMTENSNLYEQALQSLPNNSSLKPFYLGDDFETKNRSDEKIDKEKSEENAVIPRRQTIIGINVDNVERPNILRSASVKRIYED